VAGVIVAMGLAFLFSTNASAAVRYAGTTLQIFGLCTVAIGLSQIRRIFGRQSLLEKATAWFRQLAAAFRRPMPITATMSADAMAINDADLRLEVNAAPGAPLERRVALLEENLKHLRSEVDAKEKKIMKDLSLLTSVVAEERRTRETEARRISSQLEEFAVGGLHLESIGLAWLFLGVVGASIPDEIAALWQAFLKVV
jgi:hypothetical protein